MKKYLILGSMLLLGSIVYAQNGQGIGSGGEGDPYVPPVIDDPNPCCQGNYCGYPIKPLFGDRQQDLGNFNFNFTGDRHFTNKVNVGVNCGTPTLGKLNVKTNALTSTDFWGTSKSIGLSAIADNIRDWTWSIGAYTEGKTTARNTWPVGLYATASGPGNAIGVWSQIDDTYDSSHVDGLQSAGKFFVFKDSSYRNFGIEARAIGANSNTSGSNRFNIGVSGYGSTGSNYTSLGSPHSNQLFYPQSNIGIYGAAGDFANYTTPSNDYAAWFDRDVMFNGVGYNTSFAVVVSDKKFKTNIKPIENAMTTIAKLNPSTYFMKTQNEFGLHFSEKQQLGFISQEVETVLPELITNLHKPAGIDENGKEFTKETDIKAMNYMGLIALLTKGIQEQQKEIDELKALVQSLAGSSNKPTGIAVSLSDKNSVVLNQNVPNPFAESTTISYNIPDNFGQAQIIISTVDGKVIKAVSIQQKGSGSLNVFANDLSQGIYSYSLVVDGKILDTKKMVKQ